MESRVAMASISSGDGFLDVDKELRGPELKKMSQ